MWFASHSHRWRSLDIFPYSNAAVGNRTHVSSVAPLWGTLSQNGLQTEVPWPGHTLQKLLMTLVFVANKSESRCWKWSEVFLIFKLQFLSKNLTWERDGKSWKLNGRNGRTGTNSVFPNRRKEGKVERNGSGLILLLLNFSGTKLLFPSRFVDIADLLKMEWGQLVDFLDWQQKQSSQFSFKTWQFFSLLESCDVSFTPLWQESPKYKIAKCLFLSLSQFYQLGHILSFTLNSSWAGYHRIIIEWNSLGEKESTSSVVRI